MDDQHAKARPHFFEAMASSADGNKLASSARLNASYRSPLTISMVTPHST